MKERVLGLASLLLCGGQLLAVGISEQQAAIAARAWAGAGDAMGIRLSSAVMETKKVVTAGDYSFYVVKLQDGGSVVLSSDTESEPVVAFSSNSEFDFSEGTPAYDLLCNDARMRAKLRELAAGSGVALSSAAGGNSQKTQAEALWSELLGSAAPGGKALASAAPVTSVTDMRRDVLVKSKWNQTSGGGGNCWNYYTPNNYPCGCLATAISQIMRYFSYPTKELTPGTFACSVDGNVKNLTTRGGVFDWENMPLTLGSSEADVKREAIGHLTYDVGVSLGMAYGSDGSSASSTVVSKTLRNCFKYVSAFDFWDGKSYCTGKGGLHVLALREKIIYANLDAKRPVQLAIYGYESGHIGDSEYWSGHSVIGDGYGYKIVNGKSTAFVHINMGWQGLDDMWYNIPEINASQSGSHPGDDGCDFLYMGGATFNISSDAAGKEILSGRVVNDDGAAVEGAVVIARNDKGDKVAEAETDVHGIYAFELEGDTTYAVSATSSDGTAVSDLDGIYLKKTTGDSDYVISSSTSVGNSWGNDMTLSAPAAKIGDEVFSSLDRALAAASKKAGSGEVHIELLLPINFKETFDIDFNCLISSVEADAADTIVTRTPGAMFEVANGGRLALSNVVFEASSEMLVNVDEGGLLVVDDAVDMAVDTGVAAVQSASANGLELAGVPSSVFALKCTVAEEQGQFGIATCSLEEAEEGVKKIIDSYDDFGEVGGVIGEGMILEWGIRQVLPEDADAVGYYIDADGTTNCYARFDRLIERFLNSQEEGKLAVRTTLNLMKGGELAREIEVKAGYELTMVGGDEVSVTCGEGSGISVSGGTLTIRDVTFSGYVGEGFLQVYKAGKLVLGDGAILTDMTATSWHSAAVAVYSGGKLTMLKGSEISNCGYSTEGRSTNGYGGGVYLEEYGTFDMLGGTITNCVARTYGGGVYADAGSTMSVSGSATVLGNKRKSRNLDDDIYKFGSDLTELRLAGALVGGGIGVRWSDSSSCGKAVGQAFMSVDSGVSATSARQSLSLLQNNVNPDLVAEYNGSQLVWAEESDVPLAVSEDEAVAQVVSGGSSKYYATLNDAFRSFTGSATVNLLADTWITEPIVISGKREVLLRSKPESGPFTVTRSGDYDISVTSGATLVVAQLSLKGSATIGETECSGSTAMVRVYGSTLTLNEGAEISAVEGGLARDISAVVVWQSGRFNMNSGASIHSCMNRYNNPGGGGGSGAAVLLDGESVGYVNGGSITNCQAVEGAICVANQSVLHIRGDAEIGGNVTLKDAPCNMMVHAESKLYLDAAFTGKAGYTAGILSDEVVFGVVTANLGYDSLTNSAANFSNDTTDAYGVAVTNSSHITYLVWSSAIAKDGSVKITKDGTTATYWCVGRNPNDKQPEPQPPQWEEVTVDPFGVVSMTATADGKWIITFKPGKEWCKYTLMDSDEIGESANWQQIGETKILSASDIGSEGEFTFTVEKSGETKFWKVKGENGLKTVGE